MDDDVHGAPDHGLQFVDAVAGSGDLSRGGTNNDQQRRDALPAQRFGVRRGGASAAYQGPPLAHQFVAVLLLLLVPLLLAPAGPSRALNPRGGALLVKII